MTVLMSGFPPSPEGQVTLANWRKPPFNAWAFQHVREIVPSADIPNDPEAVQAIVRTQQDLSGVRFTDMRNVEWTFGSFCDATSTDGLVILKDGRLIHESYGNGMTATTPHFLASVSKSMLGLTAGILVGRGILDPDSLVSSIIPEIAETAYAGATVRHLLDMRVGIAFDEDYLATAGKIIEYRKATNWDPLQPGDRASDLRSFYRELTERVGPHGRAFHYVSPNTDLLGWIIERAAGTRYVDLFSELVWQPLGATRPAYITVDRLGAPRVAGGMCTTTRDLALVGQLLADGGKRHGRQIIPAEWIADITEQGDRAAWASGSFADYFPGIDMHYRSKWYVRRDPTPLMFGVGVHGQNLFVDAAANLVIAKFSSQDLPLDPDLIDLTTRFIEALRRAL